MAKEDLIKWKAIETGWKKSDIKRVYQKLKDLYTEQGSIEFEDAESLSYMLEEPLTYKLEWSLIRLCKEDKIQLRRVDGSYYLIDVFGF